MSTSLPSYTTQLAEKMAEIDSRGGVHNRIQARLGTLLALPSALLDVAENLGLAVAKILPSIPGTIGNIVTDRLYRHGQISIEKKWDTEWSIGGLLKNLSEAIYHVAMMILVPLVGVFSPQTMFETFFPTHAKLVEIAKEADKAAADKAAADKVAAKKAAIDEYAAKKAEIDSIPLPSFSYKDLPEEIASKEANKAAAELGDAFKMLFAGYYEACKGIAEMHSENLAREAAQRAAEAKIALGQDIMYKEISQRAAARPAWEVFGENLAEIDLKPAADKLVSTK